MTPIEMVLNNTQWTAVDACEHDGDLPYITHEGLLELFDIKLRVYRLSSGEAVIDTNDMNKLFFGY